jgi:hypothetical protein
VLSFMRQIVSVCIYICVYRCDNNNIGTYRHRLHHTLNGLALVVVVMAPPVTFYSFAAVRFSHRHDKLVD